MNHHNKGRRLPPEPLSKDEVLALMGACKRCPTGLRDRALIATLWRGQLRISEALALKVADFDREACTLRVLHGKGDKCRLAVIDREAVEVLLVWLDKRKELGINGNAPIFCTLKGKPIASAQVREMLPRRAKKAGVEKRCHAHGLRHTGASELAQEGVPITEVAAQLGHSSIATTAKYLHQLNPVARIARLKAREW